MDTVSSIRQISHELLVYAEQQAVDLGPILKDIIFEKDGRSVFLWRKDSAIHYNMQGSIKSLPAATTISAAAFRGTWSEVGVVGNIAEAYTLVKAWLLDAAEVDALPKRSVRQHGIG